MIGYLGGGSTELCAELLRAFRQGLKEVGFVEDRCTAMSALTGSLRG
jgi:hypothetical protein